MEAEKVKMNPSPARSGVMGGVSERVSLPDGGGRRIPAQELWVVFVRQWVDWKDSELGRSLDLGTLIPRQWVGRDQNEKILMLISLDSSRAFCPQWGQVLATGFVLHCLSPPE